MHARDGAPWFPQRAPSIGQAACQKYERTPDMGHVPGPGRSDALKGHHLWECRVQGARKDPRYGTRTRDGATWFSQRSPSMGGAACQEHERTPDMGRGAGMVRPDAPQRSPSMGCAPHGPPARGLLAAPRLGAAPPDPRGGGHPRPRRRRAGSPTPPVTRGIGLCAALLFLLFFRAAVERGEDVEALPSCSDCACACATAGA